MAVAEAKSAAAFRAACADELNALKPGNVHVHAAGHRMTVQDFVRSADAAAGPLCRAGAGLGDRILGAVAATRAEVGQNTNLGIVLLCAPLAMASERSDRPGALQPCLRAVLDEADLDDAQATFRAIALASPGGLGDAPRHDVRQPATVRLAVAMAEAAGRDSIARQWISGFADVFDTGLGSYQAALASGLAPPWATVATYLEFLATLPDSHVQRRHGEASAQQVRCEAGEMRQRFRSATEAPALAADLLDWDSRLKARGLNPGTSADLTVATLFAHGLLAILRARTDDG